MYEPLNIFLRAKYVDDVTNALDKLKSGTRWCPIQRAMIWNPGTASSEEEEDRELLTMREYAKAASSVIGCLNFTWDSPGNNANKRMPVLDTQFWVGPPARSEGVPTFIQDRERLEPRVIQGELKDIALYLFFKKPMANQNPNRSNNALPEKSKVTNSVQEVIRRAKNTSRHLEAEELRKVLWRYMGELKAGGYSKSWRQEVLEAGLVGYGRMWAKEIKEGHPINRDAMVNKVKRRHYKV